MYAVDETVTITNVTLSGNTATGGGRRLVSSTAALAVPVAAAKGVACMPPMKPSPSPTSRSVATPRPAAAAPAATVGGSGGAGGSGQGGGAVCHQ